MPWIYAQKPHEFLEAFYSLHPLTGQTGSSRQKFRVS
jgi:hypothetical protein